VTIEPRGECVVCGRSLNPRSAVRNPQS
jgi:hypothetical protein